MNGLVCVEEGGGVKTWLKFTAARAWRCMTVVTTLRSWGEMRRNSEPASARSKCKAILASQRTTKSLKQLEP